MAVVSPLRRVLVATSTSLLLRRAAPAKISRPLLLTPSVPLQRPWPLHGAAARFRSTVADATDSKVPKDECPSGSDYKHWIIFMNFPDPKPSYEEMVETYLQTLAKVVGSYEEAKRTMYAFSTTFYTGFQAAITEETACKFYGLPGVSHIFPDAYVFPDKKQYGGDLYDNGVITPFRPYHYWGKSSRPDRNHAFERNDPNSPPKAGSSSSA